MLMTIDAAGSAAASSSVQPSSLPDSAERNDETIRQGVTM